MNKITWTEYGNTMVACGAGMALVSASIADGVHASNHGAGWGFVGGVVGLLVGFWLRWSEK